MRVLWANIADVWREAAARWTLVAYFFLSTIFIIIFASAINLDIVDGALAGAQLFGKDVQMNSEVSIERIVLGAQSIFSVIIYAFCVLLAIFATAHLVPRMQEKGTIDLYLSRPVSRTKLLLSRYFAGLLLAGSNVFYLLGSIWLIVIWKTHVVHPRFLVAGAVILFVIAVLLAFAFLVGVVTSSTAVSIMASVGVFMFSGMLVGHDRIAAALSREWQAAIIQTLYWVIPKTAELGAAVFTFVSANSFGSKIELSASPFITTAAFGLASLTLAIWRFHKKEF